MISLIQANIILFFNGIIDSLSYHKCIPILLNCSDARNVTFKVLLSNTLLLLGSLLIYYKGIIPTIDFMSTKVPLIDDKGEFEKGWSKWASSSGKILPELIYFLADNRELFHRLDTEKKLLNFPTPRSWTDGALILGDYLRNKGLSSWRDVPATKLKNIFFDQVGPQAAGKFGDFLDILRKATDSDIEEMLTDPDNARIIPEFKKEKRFIFGLSQTLINKVLNGDPEKLLNMVKYISRYGQFEILAWLIKRIYDKFPEFGKYEPAYKDEPGWEFRKKAVDIIVQGKKEQGL
jgi:hypothetical protein